MAVFSHNTITLGYGYQIDLARVLDDIQRFSTTYNQLSPDEFFRHRGLWAEGVFGSSKRTGVVGIAGKLYQEKVYSPVDSDPVSANLLAKINLDPLHLTDREVSLLREELALMGCNVTGAPELFLLSVPCGK